jgi:hypothetical protein
LSVVLLEIARAGADAAALDEFVAMLKKAIESNRYKDGDWVQMVSTTPAN